MTTHKTDAPKHGERRSFTDPSNNSKMVKIWFQPDYAGVGRWVSPEEWAGIYNGTDNRQQREAAPQTGATVKGYRTLTNDETEMMNQLKSTSAGFLAQLAVVQKAIDAQYAAAKQSGNVFELDRLDNACPRKWLAKAVTSMQEACMFGCRSVAQPSGDS